MNAPRALAAVMKVARRARGARLRVWARLWGAEVGRRVELERGVLLRWGPHHGLSIGDGVYLGRGVVLDVPPSAHLEIGNDSKVMHYSVVAAAQSVVIGRLTQVAEHCSVRDSDHALADEGPMIFAPAVTAPVTIGDDVWIARGVAVLRGSQIGDGAVVGANSVVRGSVPPLGVAVGAPARLVKFRARNHALSPEGMPGAHGTL